MVIRVLFDFFHECDFSFEFASINNHFRRVINSEYLHIIFEVCNVIIIFFFQSFEANNGNFMIIDSNILSRW